MSEALNPDREQYGPQSLNKPQEKLGKKNVPDKDVIDVDYDAETDALLSELGIEVDSSTDSPLELEAVEEKDEKYHTSASRVYEIANQFERDKSPLSDEQKKSLQLIKDWCPGFISDEEKVSGAIKQNLAKLNSAFLQVGDEKKTAVQQRITKLRKELTDSEKRLHDLRVFDRYVGMLFLENNNRMEGKAGAAPKVQDAETVEQKPVETQFNSATFKNELVSDPRFKGDWDKVNEVFAGLVIPSTYPDMRMGVKSSNPSSVLSDVQADFTSLDHLIKEMRAYVLVDLAGRSVDDNKKIAQIEQIILPPLVELRSGLEKIKNREEDSQFNRIVNTWRTSSLEGLGKSEFATITSQIKTISENKFTSLSEYQQARERLDLAKSTLTNNGGQLVNNALDVLRKKGVPDSIIARERDEIQRKYIDSVTVAQTTLEDKAFEFWKKNRLKQVFGSLVTMETQKPASTRDYKTNYDLRKAEISRLKAEKNNIALELPGGQQSLHNAAAISEFDRAISSSEASVQGLLVQQVEHWKNVDMDSKKSPMLRFSAAVADGLVVAVSGVDDIAVSRAQAELVAAQTEIESAGRSIAVDLISDTAVSRGVADFIAEQKKKAKEVDDKLKERKDSFVATDKLAKVAKATATINRITATSFNEAEAEAMGLIALKKLKDQLSDDLNAVPANEMAALNYTEAKSKIDIFIEHVDLKEILDNPDKLVQEIINKSLNPFVTDSERQSYPDVRSKALLIGFKKFYWDDVPMAKAGESLNEKDAREKKEQHWRFLRTKIWAHRAAIETDTGTGKPAGFAEKTLDLMKERSLSRLDIVMGITNDPTHGAEVRNMLAWAIDVVSKPDKKMVGGPEVVNPFGYGNITKMTNGDQFLRDELFRRYCDDSSKGGTGGLPKEVFDTAWNLYFSFDLLSISLAKRQKGTETRGHNNEYKVDPNTITRPLHYMEHTRNKGGNLDSGNQHLLVFMDGCPDDAGVDTNGKPIDPENGWYGIDDRGGVDGVKTTQRMVKEFINSYFPIDGDPVNGVRGIGKTIRVDSSGLDADALQSWDDAIFPDHFDFLTESSMDRIPSDPGMYQEGLKGMEFILDTMLKKMQSFDDLSAVFGAGGTYKAFTDNIGKAIVVKGGKHVAMMQGFMQYFIGLTGAYYSKTDVTSRAELNSQFADQLELGTRWNNDKLGFKAIVKSLRNVVNDRTMWSSGDKRKSVSPLLRDSRELRRGERKIYLDDWYKTETRRKSEPKVRSLNPDKYEAAYWDALGGKTGLPQILDRANVEKSAHK